jgi:hypothetical protein
MESDEQVPEYIEFERLEDTTENFGAVVEQLHSDNWKINFEAINTLRKLNKFRKDELVNSIQECIEVVVVLVDSPRSSLAKQCLICLTELFSSFHENLIPIVTKLSALLLVKSTNEKSFIRQEATKSIQKICENFHLVPEIIEIFRSNCFHKSPTLSQNSFTVLSLALANLPEGQVFDICLSLDSCSRQNIKVACKATIKGLSTTWAGFNQHLASLDESKKKIVEAYLAEKGRRLSLREQRMAEKGEKKQEEPADNI